MTSKEIVITELLYKVESNGSIDPSSAAYRSEWTYKPEQEESEFLLNDIKVNYKSSLKEYFSALTIKDEKFLDELKLKPEKQGSENNYLTKPINEGGSTTSWQIRAISSNGDTIILRNENPDFQILEFPVQLVITKGKLIKTDKDGNSINEELNKPLRSPKNSDFF